MATLRDIKRRITAVQSTAKITQAMRMVSAAKLRRAQTAILSARPYVLKLEEILKNLISAVGEDYQNPLSQERTNVQNIAVIVISSDRGFCGSFNSSLFRYTNKLINEDLPKMYPDSNSRMILVGRKACNFFRNTGKNIIKEYPGAFQKIEFSTVKDIMEIVIGEYLEQRIDRVIIVFNEFKNLISQVPRNITLLPIEKPEIEDETKKNITLDYIFEPDKIAILDELLPKHLDIQLWRTMLESNAAEEAARMMAMENATNNANDLIRHLELVYNKERQAAITKEMLEIVSGAEALKR